jgi:hypothetical protein
VNERSGPGYLNEPEWEKTMRAWLQIRWLVAIAAMSWAGACRCPPPPTDNCDDVVVAFVSPSDGDTVAATLDAKIQVTTAAGDAIAIDSATLETRLVSGADFSPPRMGTVSMNTATFSGVTLDVGQSLLKATVVKSGGSMCTGTRTIAVTVQPNNMGDPAIATFKFQGDANSDNVLNATEAPLGQAVVALLTAQRAEGCQVSVVDQTDMTKPPYGMGTFTNGAASVTLAGTENLSTGGLNLQAKITCAGTPPRMNDLTTNAAATTMVTFKRVAPTCTLVSPSKMVLGPLDDADPMTTGYQVDTLGMATGADTLEMKMSSPAGMQTTGPQAAGNGTLSHRFTEPQSGETTYTVTLIASDTAGNSTPCARAVTLDFVGPTVTITSPAATMSPYNTFNVDLSADIMGGAGGTATFTIMGPTGTIVVGPVAVTGTSVTVPYSFPVAGMYTVSVTAVDAVGNAAAMASSVMVQINGIGCPLSFIEPSKNPALLTPADDLLPAVADLQYLFRAQSSAACSGKTVTLYRGTGATKMMLASGAADTTGLFSSQQTLMDTNNTSVRFEADIDDGAGHTTSAFVDVTVALTVPTIIQPAAVNNPLNAAKDLDRSTAGCQDPLQFSPAPPSGFMAVLCSTVQLTGSPGPCPGDMTAFIVPLGSNVSTSTPSFTFPDGTYAMKIVFTNGTTTLQGVLTSPFLIDTVRPTVTSVAFTGDANADKKLNIAELPSGNPVAQVVTAGVEDGNTITVRQMGTTVGTGTVTANAASVTLTGLGLTATTEADFPLVVTVTDSAGNPNATSMMFSPDPVNMPAVFTLRVDRVRPVSTIVLPNLPQLGLADDADTATGYQVKVTASTSSDVGMNGLKLSVTGGPNDPPPQSVTPTSGTATALFTVPSPGTVQYTVTAVATDSSGNQETAGPTRMVTVDLDPPTCTLTAPTAAAQPTNGYTTFALTTTATVGGANGLNALIFDKIGAGTEVQVDSLPVSGGMASKVVTYPGNGMQTVRVQVTDLANNSCSDSQTILINAMGCPIAFTAPATNPAYLNKSNDSAPASPTTLEYTLTGTTGCPSSPIHFFKTAGELAGSPVMTDGTGSFSFPISLPEGPDVLTAQMNVGTMTSASVNVTVDLTPPVLSGVSPSAATQYFVNAQNLNLLPPANPAYIQDTGPASGAQYVVSLTATGAVGGTAAVYYQGGTTPVGGPVPISADGVVPGGISVTLPHNTTGQIVVQLTDIAGNSVTQTFNGVVDVLRPDPPVSLTGSVVAGDERFAHVSLTWMPSGDDGAAATGAGAGYIVRWTNSTVSPTGLAMPGDFFDSTKIYTGETDSAWSAGSISRQIVTPPLTTIYAYVRAKDEVGNYSDSATVTVDNTASSRKLTLANPRTGAAATDQFGVFMAAGNLNNDPADDLVVGFGATAPNRVFVYYGGASFGSAAPQEIPPPDPAQPDGGPWVGMGLDVSVGNAGDSVANAGAQSRGDLLISAGLSNGNDGLAVLYFGSPATGQLDTSDGGSHIIFSGSGGQRFGRTAQIVPDINGDGFDDVLISASNEASLRGRVYLFFGRTISQWQALPQPVTPASADRSFYGPMPSVAGGNSYGISRNGFANIGAIGSAKPDFTIPCSREAVNRLNIFAGSTVAAASAGTTYTTGTDVGDPDQSLQTLTAPTGSAGNGLGTRVQGLFDAVGSTAQDVLVTYPAQGHVMIFDRTAASLAAPFTTISGSGARIFGTDTRAFDYTGDGHPDLAIGEFAAVAGTGWWFFRNSGVAGSEFDTTAGTGFFSVQILAASGGRLGGGMAVGDFDGDGKLDIAVSDDKDGLGKVFVWH